MAAAAEPAKALGRAAWPSCRRGASALPSKFLGGGVSWQQRREVRVKIILCDRLPPTIEHGERHNRKLLQLSFQQLCSYALIQAWLIFV